MKDIAVVGAGHIGGTVAALLAQTGDYRVTVIDRSAEQLAELGPISGVEHLVLEVTDEKALAAALKGKFAVLSAAPYHLTFEVAKAAKAAGAHYLDLT